MRIAIGISLLAAVAWAQDAVSSPIDSSALQKPMAEWTFLIFLNAKNNLEAAGIADFKEMARVGSNPNVNVLVQMGRPSDNYTPAEDGWSGVYRFRIEKGMRPIPSSAIVNLSLGGANLDMGDPETLEDFIRWGKHNYPSKRTMLVIWNHGQGWRLQAAKNRDVRVEAAKPNVPARSTNASSSTRTLGGFRSVSSDDDSGNVLYNSQIQKTLESLKSEGHSVDVLGFDACLMSMIETAFAFNGLADYMVGSQELEPGNGWNYETILKSLEAKPAQSERELAVMLVEKYRDEYKDDERTTLSALKLSEVPALAESVSKLGNTLEKSLSDHRDEIAAARGQVLAFGAWNAPPLSTSIDLRVFLIHLQAKLGKEAKGQIDDVLHGLESVIVSNYRSAAVANEGYGGNGLAIYFPATKDAFKTDPDSSGYKLENENHPLAILATDKTNGWGRFLEEYLDLD